MTEAPLDPMAPYVVKPQMRPYVCPPRPGVEHARLVYADEDGKLVAVDLLLRDLAHLLHTGAQSLADVTQMGATKQPRPSEPLQEDA